MLKIGVLATLVGPFTILGQDGVRGVEMAVREFGGQVAGEEVRLITRSTLIDPDTAEREALELLQQSDVDLIVGPLSGNEGLRIKQIAKQYPHKTFLNGTSGAQELTFVDPAPNLFNFAMTGAQLMKGLGTYVYQTLGYRRIAVISENYSYPHAQYGAFKLEYCRLGGQVLSEAWVAVMTNDFVAHIEAIPKDVDAVFALMGGDDAILFAEQYAQSGFEYPLIGGIIQGDQTVLSYPEKDASNMVGMITAGATADDNDNPLWQEFVAVYRDMFPDGFSYPSYFALSYYLNTKAALLAIEELQGDLGEHQSALQTRLQSISFEGPSGPVYLDHHKQVVTTNYLVQIDRDPDGRLYRKLVETIPDVTQTLGLDEDEYRRLGTFSPTNPPCG